MHRNSRSASISTRSRGAETATPLDGRKARWRMDVFISRRRSSWHNSRFRPQQAPRCSSARDIISLSFVDARRSVIDHAGHLCGFVCVEQTQRRPAKLLLLKMRARSCTYLNNMIEQAAGTNAATPRCSNRRWTARRCRNHEDWNCSDGSARFASATEPW